MDQRRLLIAALLSIVVLLGWGLLFPPPERPSEPVVVEEVPLDRPATRPAQPPASAAEDPVAAPDEAPPPVEAVAASREEIVVVETADAVLRFTNLGAQLISYQLRDTLNRSGDPLEMVRARSSGVYPFALTDTAGASHAVDRVLFAVEERPSPSSAEPVLRFRYAGPEGQVTKEFHFLANGMFDVRVEARGVGPWGLLLGPGLRNPNASEIESRFELRAASHATRDQPEQYLVNDVDEEIRIPGVGVSWFGLEDTYFLTVFAPLSPVAEAAIQPLLIEPVDADSPPRYLPRPPEDRITEAQEDLVREVQVVLIPSGERLEGEAYFGPKSYPKLAALPYDLERTIRWGLRIPVISTVLDPLVGLLARWMLLLLLWIHDTVVANFGWSIVLLTVLIKLILLPLTHKSYVSMQKMQKLQPKIEAIKSKYRGKQRDKQGRPNLESQRKMNEEMQALFRAEGVNPAAGCLPLLLQMPVFFALFSLLRNTVELWGAPWAFWIHDLSVPDPFYALPIIMGLAQFLQQRMTPMTNANPGQRIMLTTMPIWLTVISFGFASGLVLYWLTNSLLTMVQQGSYQRLKRAGFFGGEPTPPPTKPAKKTKERGKKK